MIQAQHLTKFYGLKPAIQDVTFSVAAGEIVGFLGPNGAGKTTTLRLLTGYMPPTHGTATVNGKDVLFDSLESRRQLGYMPENVALYEDMRVEDYLQFMAVLRDVPRNEVRKAAARVMELCGLTEQAKQLIGTLSKGYRQRVGLAQALVHDPPVLILDEPTVGLDPGQILEVRQLIKSLAGEHTILLSSHILPEVQQVCQRVIIINKGRVVAEDTPQHLESQLTGNMRVQVTVAKAPPNLQQELQRLPGVVSVSAEEPSEEGVEAFSIELDRKHEARGEVARAIVEAGAYLLEFAPQKLSLEEIFLQLTTEEPVEAKAS